MLTVLFSLIRASIRSQMQYRASFALWSVGNFSAVGVEFLGDVVADGVFVEDAEDEGFFAS